MSDTKGIDLNDYQFVFGNPGGAIKIKTVKEEPPIPKEPGLDPGKGMSGRDSNYSPKEDCGNTGPK